MEPKVSIIITSYNYAHYVRQTIHSALEQRYANTEVIVVDDGSTDDSRRVIESFGSRIKTLFKENGGQASAFHAGFALSSGDIVIFLDSDDLLYPDAVQKVVEVWNPALSKVHFPLEVIDAQSQPTDTLCPPHPLPEGDLRREVYCFGGYLSPPTSGNAWSRGFLQQVFPLSEQDWPIDPDGPLILLAPFFGKVKALSIPLGGYRLHGHNNGLRPYFDLAFMRRELKNDLRLDQLVERWAREMGYHPQAPKLSSVVRLRNRVVSFRLQPQQHPYPDTRLRLGWLALKTTWLEPRLNWLQRLKYTFYFAAMSLLPIPQAEHFARWADSVARYY